MNVALVIGVWSSVCVASASDAHFRPTDLTVMSWDQLECIYREAKPGRIPCGFASGRVVYCSSSLLAGVRSSASQLLWRGKQFCPDQGMLINQWRGFQAI